MGIAVASTSNFFDTVAVRLPAGDAVVVAHSGTVRAALAVALALAGRPTRGVMAQMD